MLRRRAGRADHGHDATGIIYGTVITAGTMIGAAEASHNEGEIAATVVVTLVIYWIAHSYAAVLGGAHSASPSWRAAVRELVEESTIVVACVLPLAALILASWLGAGFGLSVSIASWFTMGLLFIWGYLAARRLHAKVGAQVVSALVFGLLGLGIVALRAAFIH